VPAGRERGRHLLHHPPMFLIVQKVPERGEEIHRERETPVPEREGTHIASHEGRVASLTRSPEHGA